MSGEASNDKRPASAHTAAFERFRESMICNYERWHDGIGYDLAALDEMTDEERKSVAAMLKGRTDWRDIEALAHLNPPEVTELRRQFDSAEVPSETRLRAGEELEELGEAVDFVPLLLVMLDEALEDTTVLTRVMEHLEERHPGTDERIKLKLLRLLDSTTDPVATNLAAIAMVVYDLIPTQHDWAERPFWLRFQEPNDHDAAMLELCRRIGLSIEQVRQST